MLSHTLILTFLITASTCPYIVMKDIVIKGARQFPGLILKLDVDFIEQVSTSRNLP